MSLECIDNAVKAKLLSVYPNVVFGPLSRALENDTETVVKYDRGGLVVTSDSKDYEIINGKNENKIASGENKAPDYGTSRTSKNGVVAFPLIAVDRISNGFDFGTTGAAGNDPLIRRGWKAYQSGTRERAFPISPIYQIDIISNRRFEVDEIFRELCMYLYLSPNLEVHYSPGTDDEFVEEFPLILMDNDPTWDVETFTDKGIIYRQTITAKVHDAKMLFHKDIPLIEVIPIHVEPLNEDWIVKEDNLK